MKETIVKMNKTKNWFFEKINKVDKHIKKTHQEKSRHIKKNREAANQQN